METTLPTISSIAVATIANIIVPILPKITELPNLHKHLVKVLLLKQGTSKRTIIRNSKTAAIIAKMFIKGTKFTIKPKKNKTAIKTAANILTVAIMKL